MFGKFHFDKTIAISGAILFALTGAAPYSHATNVACVGNSITEGYGIWGDKKYPDHLQEMLGDSYSVTNFGVSSMTTAPATGKPKSSRPH